ncbi:MAG: hypothetical protein A3A97_04475 [Candidatus Terrybacteria bacterium RIFCSPLOWO2_01_FULL_40_23]|uniref:ParB/Sulfiredoxin domain-containing protein n=1 Tax=Candidatus Terrybacteria bacterium RIFCSPLOWO2_01_FULL_40_23 TaxID=1802366 RepID=A0A1G2PUY9_9BACT|nr:MAG: hypothetical protein A3A97_04475 [Candidatus Terrybacteria bacterium RIFCSPLOWO2_01_FULL_40_23]
MQQLKTNFPDKEYLEVLISHFRKKALARQQPFEQLLTLSGVSMNWIADYIFDENVAWSKETLSVDDLSFTGTNSTWNKILLEQCERSPKRFRELLQNDSSILQLFADAKFNEVPILVRWEEKKYKVLDGMHRVVAAIRDDKEIIIAYVARHNGIPKTICEPHVVYDLLKAYHRKLNTDREGLIAALRFLKTSYANVEDLLRERFNKSGIPSDEMQQIIQEALRS